MTLRHVLDFLVVGLRIASFRESSVKVALCRQLAHANYCAELFVNGACILARR